MLQCFPKIVAQKNQIIPLKEANVNVKLKYLLQ